MSELLEASMPSNRETEYQGSKVALAPCQSISYQDHPPSVSKRGCSLRSELDPSNGQGKAQFRVAGVCSHEGQEVQLRTQAWELPRPWCEP